MQIERKKHLLLLTFTLCSFHFAMSPIFLPSPLVRAAEADRDLEGIKKKIERERRGITTVKKKEGSVLESLGKIDGELDRKNKELKKINGALDSILADIKKKEAEARKIDSSIDARKDLLRHRAAALYKWQRMGTPFILLNGAGSVGELMQRRHYLQATLSYDRALVDRLSDESERQQALKKELEQKKEEMSRQKKALTNIKESIRQDKQKKQEVLASLRREKGTRQRALKELEQAAQRLQKMMDEISRRSAALPRESLSGTGLEAMRGKLEYPARGAVTSGFGKTQHPEFSAELFRKGIDIDAPLGEEVRAVETGKIVFADRFSGYGKMMIIDHGQRYYTIYAHLAELFKKSGDPVRKGEPIALVGDSDSLAGARLYFEIRKDGRPVDPAPWFRK
jgi:septal ring factor EnvC (AmiA/AmiB activator)